MRQLRHPLPNGPSLRWMIFRGRDTNIGVRRGKSHHPELVISLDVQSMIVSILRFRSRDAASSASAHQLPAIWTGNAVLTGLRFLEMRTGPHEYSVLFNRWEGPLLERARKEVVEVEPGVVREAVYPCLRVRLGAPDGADVVGLAVVWGKMFNIGLDTEFSLELLTVP